MQQFAQCSNCQQWYLRVYTTSVELYAHERLYALAVWCLQCIDAATRRSQPLPEARETPDDIPRAFPVVTSPTYTGPREGVDPFPALMQEHLALMDRALYDEETVLLTVVQEFVERCQRYQPQAASPEQDQRLAGHIRYWQTFLQALHPHP